MSDPRIVAASRIDEDAQYEVGLRPRSLDDYIGQDRVRENLQVSIAAARNRGEALDHVLLYGPPGLGKTTLATVIANELGTSIRSTAGPVIERPGDLAGMLTALNEREVIFIDEIHRLAPNIEEILYPAMEDFELDIMIGSGPAARSVKVPLKPFTLIGATTRAGLLTAPLRARFGIVHRLDFYNVADIEEIVRRSARILGVALDAEAALELARRSRGTPRIANNLLRWVRDFAQVRAGNRVDRDVADQALTMLDIDQGPSARSVRLNLPKFTLIGATTRAGMISAPLRSRFGMNCRLDYYTADELQKIVLRSAGLIGLQIDDIKAGGAEQ